MLVCLAASAPAQQTSTASETKTFEVLAVTGNQLDVKLPEGTREITVPNDFRFTVDGKQLSVHQLKPGMKGTATITTTTTVTPVTVTEVRNGTVMRRAGGNIIVRTDEGIRMFSQSDADRRDVKIIRNGRPARVSDFREGDRLTATIVTTKPPEVMTERQVEATLAQRPTPAPAEAGTTGAPAAGTTRSAAAGRTRSAAAGTTGSATAGAPASAAPPTGTAQSTAGAGGTATSSARRLPKTGSALPLLAFAGLASLVTGAALTARRRRMLR
jgi:LPXTG-motif cell wall-anchored protein